MISVNIVCAEVPSRIHLSWDDSNTTTTMVVTWDTGANDGTEVQYGLTGSYGSSETGTSFYSSTPGRYIHTVKLTGLDPDTKYYYRCGSSSGWSSQKDFETAPLKTDTTRGLKVFMYTLNDREDIALIKSMGVDGIFSDFPDRL